MANNNSKLSTRNSKLVLITGAAGFIGFHLSQRLLARGNEVIGLDNLNNYYDVNFKL
ncbi:MAG TPA: NAD-dependent epimerase/dehydratase family protein, partial [Candidatus Brocadiaceae bacterium]